MTVAWVYQEDEDDGLTYDDSDVQAQMMHLRTTAFDLLRRSRHIVDKVVCRLREASIMVMFGPYDSEPFVMDSGWQPKSAENHWKAVIPMIDV